MNYVTHNQKEGLNPDGTYLMGYIDIEYAKLVSLLGEPTDADGHKVDAQWEIQFEDGLVATIYNWKNGKNYKGDEGLEVTEIIDWHIGGLKKEVVDRVHQIFASETKPVLEIPGNYTKKEKLSNLVVELLTQSHEKMIEKISKVLNSGAIDIDKWNENVDSMILPKIIATAILEDESTAYNCKGTSFEKKIKKEVKNIKNFI